MWRAGSPFGNLLVSITEVGTWPPEESSQFGSHRNLHGAAAQCQAGLAGPNKKKQYTNKEEQWKELGPEAFDLVRRTVDSER